MADENKNSNGLETAVNTARAVQSAVKTGKAIANIARGASTGGLYGAAFQAVVTFRKPIAIMITVLVLLPVLIIVMLPQVIFNGLNPPDGDDPINDPTIIVENVSEINQSISALLTQSYERVKSQAQSSAANQEYAEVVDEVGGEITLDANKVICWYSASKNESPDEISIDDLVSLVASYADKLYYIEETTEQREIEVELEPREEESEDDDDIEEDGSLSEIVEVTYHIYTVCYAGDEILADGLFHLTEEQKLLSDAYAENLTIFLYDHYEATANGTHNEIKDLIDKEEPVLDDSSFGSPFPGMDWSGHISSGFGGRPYPGVGSGTSDHTGLDLAFPAGTAIHAVKGGTVLFVRDTGSSGYGKHVAINHGGGVVTLYAHCSALLVTAGQQIEKGDVIARVGQTGWATGNHLHIEVIIDGKPVNPLDYISN